jgi:uncharacterized membrane protein YjjB (DUF3815 family)
MTLEERSDLILAFARVLYVNGQSTDQTLAAILRRGVAQYSANVFLQPFCAALLAGVIGGLAARYELSWSLRLVAVCPCMILVPGPHVLNGALDLVKGRIDLGAARLIYAGLVIAVISIGLLLGLTILGVSLPVDEAGGGCPCGKTSSPPASLSPPTASSSPCRRT